MFNKQNRSRYLQALLLVFVLIWVALAIHPLYRSDWWLENILVFITVPLLLYNHRKNPLSSLSYTLIFIFLVLHTVGAHYTYAEVPLGKTVSRWMGLERNHFDRLVHFLSGFLLTIPVFEMLRKKGSRQVKFVFIFACCILGLVGMLYEVVEWLTAIVVDPDAGAAYLGTQGDEWDAQKDMLLNFAGEVASVVFLPAVLNRGK